MDRTNHYERAFEAYLHWHGLGYIAVDETRRALFGDTPVKSLDFVVFGDNGNRLVVDVKGRRFPGGKPNKPRRVWECWSTQDDVASLTHWAEMSGPGYQGVFVFAYHLLPTVQVPDDTLDVWTWQGRRYLLRAVAADEYQKHMQVRSPRWGTVWLPAERFRALVKPFHHFTHSELTFNHETHETDEKKTTGIGPVA
jgi:hypothetical protein